MSTEDTTVDYYYTYYDNVDPSAEAPTSEEDEAYRAIQEVCIIIIFDADKGLGFGPSVPIFQYCCVITVVFFIWVFLGFRGTKLVRFLRMK